MSDEGTLWNDWGSPEPAEHIVGARDSRLTVAEPGSQTANVPDADTSPADASQPAADQAPAPDAAAEDTQQNDVPSEVDEAHIKECMQDLQSTWGDAFEPTMQSVKAIVAQAPDYIREFILSARDESGRAIANDPIFIKWMASLAPSGGSRQVNPPEGDSSALDTEIAQIEAKIGTREYIRNETMQVRLRTLYEARGR